MAWDKFPLPPGEGKGKGVLFLRANVADARAFTPTLALSLRERGLVFG